MLTCACPFRTARTEPMGERLRLLYDGTWTLGGLTGNKHNLAGARGGLQQPPMQHSWGVRT